MRLFKSKEKLSESESVYLADIEQKIKAYKAKGYRVPTRKMIKTAAQIKGIRRSAAINTAVLDLVAAHIHEGMTTEEIDTLVYNFTIAHGAIPAPLNYEGFPKSVCTSVNDEVCHGIPSKDVVLRNGDIINVDVSTILDGYFSDASRMFMIGKVSPEMQRLVQVARECLEVGLQAPVPGASWGISELPFKNMLKATGILSYGNSAGMGWDSNFMKILLSAMSDAAVPVFCWYREWYLLSNR